ncbi:hypothetical protein [Spartinivicinus ruber]|uniref:hypothetical protein n=1 Tax=Spartinivicinus ruber TaxID=2683272 RepID=UPI0013D7CF65|nr:hypothetical protein [Spartinivicinus ruber]
MTFLIELVINPSWIEDVQGYFFLNLIGLVYLAIPFLIALILCWSNLKDLTNKQSFNSVCLFPVVVIVFTLLYLPIFILMTGSLEVLFNMQSIRFIMYVLGLELLMGAPWVVLSLLLIPVLKRISFIKTEEK